MTSMSFSEQQHTSDITHTSTKRTKLITVFPILYYFKILSNRYRLKAHCHPRISYGHTKLISQVHSEHI